MIKQLLSASALALLLATPAVAASQSDRSTPATARPATSDVRTDLKADTRADQPKVVQKSDQIDSDRLMGRNIVNAAGERVGEIDSVLIGRDGKIQAVIVGVGGFLGLGEHKVAIDWNDLQFMDNGQRVVTSLSKDQLKGMPEFRYAEREPARDRTDRLATRDVTTPAAPATGAQMRAETRTTPAETRTTTTAMSDRPVGATTTTTTTTDRSTAVTTATTAKPLGQMRAEEIIGKNVVNARGQTVGEIEDLVIDNNKAVHAIVSVGGFLGMGDKDVAIPFEQLKLNDRNAILMSEQSEDQLKQLPAWKKGETWRSVERNRPVLDR